jgi:glycosyltransferase involved in cell wall biosynthesis
MASWVKEEIKRRGLVEQFAFLGQLPSTAMPSIFAEADALLVALRPDSAFSLTIPGKVQSYLSAGKPVLAMLDGEGARVIVESGGGLASAAGDASGLVGNVTRLCSLPQELRAEMGQRGREYAWREFGREVLFDRLEAWMRECVAEWSHRGKR